MLFCAEIEQVSALVEEFERVRDGGIGMEECATVTERVGRDVDHTHDEGATAKLERARAETPVCGLPSGDVQASVQAFSPFFHDFHNF